MDIFLLFSALVGGFPKLGQSVGVKLARLMTAQQKFQFGLVPVSEDLLVPVHLDAGKLADVDIRVMAGGEEEPLNCG